MLRNKKRSTSHSPEQRWGLSPREVRNLEKQARLADAQEAKSETGFRAWFSRAMANRAATLERPGPTGWRGRGGGSMGFISRIPEYQGTTVQVCGLWPFIVGSSNPVVGAPLGYHLMRGSLVCADPVSWFLSHLVLNPSCFVFGRPGLGKSSLTKRMVTILESWGAIPMVLSDTKPDYVNLIQSMGGQVIRFGRGVGHLNFLDFGPIVRQVQTIEDPARRREALEELRGRRLSITKSLLRLVLGRDLAAHESTVISETLRVLDPEMDQELLVGQLYDFVASRPGQLQAIVLDRGDEREYQQRVQGLLDGLMGLGANGQFGDLFSAPTSEYIIPGQPMVFDISGVDSADANFEAAVQSVCWAYGSAVVSAEKHLAESQGREARHYFLIMDELWRMLRASPQMVYFVDDLSRLNRTRGIAQALITHTMKDLELADEHLTQIASGFVERSAMVFLGGLAEAEMGNLEKVFALTEQEKSQITDWSAEGGVDPDTNTAAAPPGQGKFLLKIGKKPGIPFRTVLTSPEKRVYDTNQAWGAPVASTGKH